jgi:hypothetical protein
LKSKHQSLKRFFFPDTEVFWKPAIVINDLRSDPYYIRIYINWAGNLVTGIVPLLTLALLNYLVYKHLVNRRNEINNTFDSMSNFV